MIIADTGFFIAMPVLKAKLNQMRHWEVKDSAISMEFSTKSLTIFRKPNSECWQTGWQKE
jgi:hypothetical protein